ncbi:MULTISPECIES: ABC transporter permease [Arthrobacter]|uniref:ABC transporter permease n=1 Tax=Arthrobacter terricola TaxID=2547396 RepID=A0A4V2ZUJ7_9MICC|nr:MULTISPECIES: ABC transporter permease [Arthrobacter]MBT8159574.1 ABC transporter permease [Arthrobacter sp. GN70]TDG01305.1 ABC transporter permease [Arthrobacter terricola]
MNPNRFSARLKKQPVAMAGLAILCILAVVAIVAPWITPYDPNATDLNTVLLQPGAPGHLLGTDELGRDVASRLLVGGRVSLIAALQGTGIALVIGVPLGLVSGFFGAWVDKVIMFVTDALMSFPALLLAMAIAGILGPNLTNAMTAIGLSTAPRAIRLVRGSVLGIREETYIEAARSIGTPSYQIVFRHILPNVLAPLVVFAAILAGTVMLIEAGLSFIGLGVQPPEASWGAMLGSAFTYISRSPWLAVFPGVCIAISVLALNVLGDGVRDSIGKKVRR